MTGRNALQIVFTCPMPNHEWRFHHGKSNHCVSSAGSVYDNSMVETFFETIRSKLIWPIAWQSRKQAENAVARYIDRFYYPVRRIHRSASKAPSPSSERPRK